MSAGVWVQRERPIIFQSAMVTAILAGTKTQTRRVAKTGRCPYGFPGDKLWVRETWAPVFKRTDTCNGCLYREMDDQRQLNPGSMSGRWKPSIHMPRWASRITLQIVEIRDGKLQNLTEEDAQAEGVDPFTAKVPTYRDAYRLLWDDINGRGAWDSNPFVWVIEFKRIEP